MWLSARESCLTSAGLKLSSKAIYRFEPDETKYLEARSVPILYRHDCRLCRSGTRGSEMADMHSGGSVGAAARGRFPGLWRSLNPRY